MLLKEKKGNGPITPYVYIKIENLKQLNNSERQRQSRNATKVTKQTCRSRIALLEMSKKMFRNLCKVAK